MGIEPNTSSLQDASLHKMLRFTRCFALQDWCVATLAKQRLLDSLNIPLHSKELPFDKWEDNYYQNINLHSHTANELLEIYTNTLNGLHILSDKLLCLKELVTVIRTHICNNYKYNLIFLKQFKDI